MKKLILLIPMVLFCFQAQAKPTATKISRKAVCEKLMKQAEEICAEAMCEQQAENVAGTPEEGSECFQDGDFAVGQQICATEDEFPRLIEAYNKKNPKKKLNCDDL